MNLFHANEAMEANYSALDPFKTQCVNRIFFESNLFQSEKIKVIYVIDISEYLQQQQQQQQQQVVPKEDVLEVAKSLHPCK